MIGWAYFRPATTAETNSCFCVCRSICFIDCGQDVKNFLKNKLKKLPKYITHPVFNYGYHPWHMNIMTWKSHKCWKPDVFFLVLFFLVPSQPLVICRQCPGYRSEVSRLLFATGSNYWLPGLPAPPPIPPPPKPATEEGSAKPTGEQPSTSSDIPSGDYEWRLDISSFSFHSHLSLDGELLSRVQLIVIIIPIETTEIESSCLLFRSSHLNFHLRPSSAPVLSAAPQEYRCPPQGCHLICACCLRPMPDRRAELNTQQVVAQQCEWSLKLL